MNPLQLTIHLHFTHPEPPPWAMTLLRNQETIMADLDQALAEIASESTRIDSIQALITTIEKQLADALAGTTLPPAVQAKVDAVFAGLTANSAKIDQVLNTGVPAPVITPPPAP